MNGGSNSISVRGGRALPPGGGYTPPPGAPREGQDFTPSRDLNAKRDAYYASKAQPGAEPRSPWDKWPPIGLPNDPARDEAVPARQVRPERPVIPGERRYRDGDRVRHPAFPNSVCGVVYQGPMRVGGGCQFTFTCDGSLATAPAGEAWIRARRIADEALAGRVFAPVGLATHYHAKYVYPAWAPRMIPLAAIGLHDFYRLPGENGDARIFTVEARLDGRLLGVVPPKVVRERIRSLVESPAPNY